MGRNLLLEAILEEKVTKLFSFQKVQIGLILGQQSDSKDFCTHLVRCPDPVDDEAEVETPKLEANENQNNDKQSGKKKTLHQQSGKGSDIFDAKWIAEHGRQVNRMLIGGTSVLGMFVYCSSDIVAKNQTKLVQCLQGLQSRIECNKWFRKAYLHSDRYLLHICSTTKKFTCRTFDLSDKQGTSKPADCRYQQFLSNWHCASSTIDVHINISIPLSQKATETEKSILLACQDEIEQIWNSHTTEGHQLIDEDQPISGQSSKSKKQGLHVSKELKFTLFKNLSHKSVENILKKEATNLEVKFFGAIQSKAVLNSKARYGDAVNALKVDIIRSLLTRIGLLCEEAEVNNLDQVQEWSLVSPTRVFYPIALSKLYFCDYSFKDESVDDILSRFSELLNLNSKSSELVYLEKSPDISEASMLFHSPEKCVDQQSDIASEMSSSLVEEPSKNYFIYFLVALLVLLIGVAVHITLN